MNSANAWPVKNQLLEEDSNQNFPNQPTEPPEQASPFSGSASEELSSEWSATTDTDDEATSNFWEYDLLKYIW